MMKNLISLFIWCAIAFSAALFGSRFKPGEWYAGLLKPSWNPPNWIFGPVWTLLYLMMGISAWLVWKKSPDKRSLPLILFMVQLVLNALWSWVFFGLKEMGWALLEIGLLWGAILLTLIQFFQVNRWAGGLLVLYLAWVSFASFLNYTLWRLNR